MAELTPAELAKAERHLALLHQGPEYEAAQARIRLEAKADEAALAARMEALRPRESGEARLVRARVWLEGLGLTGLSDSKVLRIADALHDGATAEGVEEAVRIANEPDETESDLN